jgi:hypothetical protein
LVVSKLGTRGLLLGEEIDAIRSRPMRFADGDFLSGSMVYHEHSAPSLA